MKKEKGGEGLHDREWQSHHSELITSSHTTSSSSLAL